MLMEKLLGKYNVVLFQMSFGSCLLNPKRIGFSLCLHQRRSAGRIFAFGKHVIDGGEHSGDFAIAVS